MTFNSMVSFALCCVLLCAFANLTKADISLSPSPSCGNRRLKDTESLFDGQSSLVSVPLRIGKSGHFEMNVFFGSKKQEIAMVIETGTNSIWIPSQRQHADLSIEDYDCNDECQEINSDFHIQANGLSISGSAISDFIYLNDVAQSKASYQFLLAKVPKHSHSLSQFGVFGLGDESNEYFENQSILEVLKREGVIQEKVFSLKLKESSCFGSSKLYFGGLTEKQNSEVTYISTIPNAGWGVHLSEISLIEILNNGSPHPATALMNSKVIFETGSSRIYLPRRDLQSLIQLFREKNLSCELLEESQSESKQIGLVCPYKEVEFYPILRFNFGNQEHAKFELVPEDYIQSCQNQKTCRLVIQEADSDAIIIGTPFFLKNTVIFDSERHRIGIIPNGDSLNGGDITTVKDVFSHNVISAYIGLALTLSIMSVFLLVCHVMHLYKPKNATMICELTSPSPAKTGDFTDNEENTNGGGDSARIGETIEDPNDVSEEISFDEIQQDQQQPKAKSTPYQNALGYSPSTSKSPKM